MKASISRSTGKKTPPRGISIATRHAKELDYHIGSTWFLVLFRDIHQNVIILRINVDNNRMNIS
jgi:hypothetical protein